MPGREIGQEGGHGERRQAARAALLHRAHRVRDRGKPADPGRDHGRGALLRARLGRHPAGLRHSFRRRQQREQDEPVHLLLVLARRRQIRIEPALGIRGLVRHLARDARRQAHRPLRQCPQPGLPLKQPRPDQFGATAQRGHCPQARYDNSTHGAPVVLAGVGRTRTTGFRAGSIYDNRHLLFDRSGVKALCHAVRRGP